MNRRCHGANMEITRVPVSVARAPTGATNAYVVGEDPAALVDPGGRSDELDRALDGREIAHVVATHAHPDHTGGVAHYARETGATVWARRGYERRLAEATGLPPDGTFHEGTRIDLGTGSLTVVDLPGHTPDHVAFLVPDGDAGDRNAAGDDDEGSPPPVDAGDWAAILCGDVAVAEGSVAVAAPEGDVRAYLTSLRRLHAREPSVLYPGHGPRIDDPRSTLERLVAHRLDREARVLAAVREGAADLDAVLAAAYDVDLTGVRDLARGTVRAHVEKLAHEGTVRWDPDGGTVRPATR
jgi:glyoxylase-like metal-dependent hydrolase (beta-lactamase superfamily II)